MLTGRPHDTRVQKATSDNKKWMQFNVMPWTSYVKCIKMFLVMNVCSVFVRCFNTQSANTLLHNVILGFKNSCINVNNRLVRIVHIHLDVVIRFIILPLLVVMY